MLKKTCTHNIIKSRKNHWLQNDLRYALKKGKFDIISEEKAMQLYKKTVAVILAMLCLVTAGGPLSSADNSTGAQADASAGNASGKSLSYSAVSYEDYLAAAASDARPDEEIVIDALSFSSATAEVSVRTEKDEVSGEEYSGLYCGDSGEITWSFNVKTAGLYELSVMYFNVKDSGNDIERSLYLDGVIPYSDAGNLVFSRTWKDKGEKIFNENSGNESRRSQQEVHVWSQVSLRATTGYHDSNLLFYLSAGAHTVSFKAVNESMVIKSLTFSNSDEPMPYEQVKKEYDKNGYKQAGKESTVKVQGEDAAYKSSSTLYAVEDRSSSLNEPYELSKILLNCIGGTTWKYQGAWIEWEVEVPESGLYNIYIRAKQNFSSGVVYTKTLTVDGEIPFAEAKNMSFRYDTDWQIISPQTEDGENCLVYLTAGTTHTIRLTNTLGEFGDLLRKIENSSQTLSALYRRVCMVVGTSVDTNRDYELERYIPELMDIITGQYEAFGGYIDTLERLAGGAGEQTVSLEQVCTQLLYYIENEEEIPSKISGLSDCISSLASWITTVTDQAVLIDYITVSSPKAEVPRADNGFWGKLWNEIRAYINSYFSQYTLVESVDPEKGQSVVTLWLANTVGRDQANIIKQLAQSTYTQTTGSVLDIELVDMSILLRAVAAGNGPDVGIYIDQATPINYGIRSALQDLTEFDDLDEVLERFDEGAVIPFTFNGAVYALPETETYLMMFVRTDIFNELGLEAPQTWSELYDMVPTLNRNYYDVSLPSPLSGGDVTSTGLNGMFASLLLQNDASVYNADGSRCVLNELNAVNTFVEWSEMYTKYLFPKTTDAITYFRIGTAPIVFNNFSFYNQLVVGAPEIRGMWEMYPLPGRVDENGNIRRDVAATLTSCVMYANAKDKQASWEFLKWWTSDEIQSAYATEIEALQGKSGRWMTANVNAMETIGWSSVELAKIKEGLSFAQGIPEVAGGYYVGRSIDNAIKMVINSGEIPRETLLDYVDDINTEIISKRKELGIE